MKNTSISLFRQILDLVPKHEFEKIIMKHNGDKRKQFESSCSCRDKSRRFQLQHDRWQLLPEDNRSSGRS